MALIEDSLNDNSTEVEVEDSFNDSSDNSTEVEVEDSFNDNSDNSTEVELEDSLNDNSDNSTNTNTAVAVEVEDSFNPDSSINDSYNTEYETEVEDSFNDNSDNSTNDSYNTEHETEVEVEDSFNTDDSVNDSYNTDNSINDSFKSWDASTTLIDDSTTVGVRQYNAGGFELNLGGLVGGSGGGGDVDIAIDNRSTTLDQSVNQAINGHGSVGQTFGQSANVASGDGSVAAGGDAYVDNSVSVVETGDIAIGNTSIQTHIEDSYNDQSTEWEVEVEDSFNDNSTDIAVDDSFNNEYETEVEDSFNNEYEWENSGNLFSPAGATTGGEVELDF